MALAVVSLTVLFLNLNEGTMDPSTKKSTQLHRVIQLQSYKKAFTCGQRLFFKNFSIWQFFCLSMELVPGRVLRSVISGIQTKSHLLRSLILMMSTFKNTMPNIDFLLHCKATTNLMVSWMGEL